MTYPSPFITPEQAYKNDRLRKAILAELRVGGRVFCWHDWTYIAPAIRTHILDWGFLHKCTKCGKSKISKAMCIEPVSY